MNRRLGLAVAAVALGAMAALARPALPPFAGGSLLHVALPSTAVVAADPSPTPAAAGDPRSSGQGPGLVGQPVVAIGGVLAVGLASVAITLLYVRVTAHRRD